MSLVCILNWLSSNLNFNCVIPGAVLLIIWTHTRWTQKALSVLWFHTATHTLKVKVLPDYVENRLFFFVCVVLFVLHAIKLFMRWIHACFVFLLRPNSNSCMCKYCGICNLLNAGVFLIALSIFIINTFKLIIIDLRISYFQVSLEVEWVRMFCHLRILIFKH